MMDSRAIFLGVGLLAVGVQSITPTDSVCADQVLLQDVQRGKSAFYSDCDGVIPPTTGCYDRGQWANEENPNYGCQTCIVQEEWAAESLYAVAWGPGGSQEGDGMQPCPAGFDHGAFHTAKYGAIEVVTAAALQGTGECDEYPAGTFYNEAENRCYFKSTRSTLSTSWDQAVILCESMGGALVAINSEAEFDWFVSTLLWPGFMGETFTGLNKANGGTYEYVQSDLITQPSSFDAADVNSWSVGAGTGPWFPPFDESTEYADPNPVPRTCVEYYPMYPKLFNPFSCRVNKQYSCELPSASCRASGNLNCAAEGPSPTPTSPPVAAPTATPTSPPVAAPTATPTSPPVAAPTATPTSSPVAAPTATPTSPPVAAPTATPTSPPVAAPTATPTSPPVAAPTATPTSPPVAAPTATPTSPPVAAPTATPTSPPVAAPTATPTSPPVAAPTATPTGGADACSALCSEFEPCYTEPLCSGGVSLGCGALGSANCRFCGFGSFSGVPCPGSGSTSAPAAAPTPAATSAPVAGPTPTSAPVTAPTPTGVVEECAPLCSESEPCYTEPRCTMVGGVSLGCGALGEANCRFCGFGPFAAIPCSGSGSTSAPAAAPTPAATSPPVAGPTPTSTPVAAPTATPTGGADACSAQCSEFEPCYTEPLCGSGVSLGCGALGSANCRFCGFGSFAAIPCSASASAFPPTTAPTPAATSAPVAGPTPTSAPVTAPTPTGVVEECAPLCSEAQPCYTEPRCTMVGGVSLGCGAFGEANCRFCGFGPYADIEC